MRLSTRSAVSHDAGAAGYLHNSRQSVHICNKSSFFYGARIFIENVNSMFACCKSLNLWVIKARHRVVFVLTHVVARYHAV